MTPELVRATAWVAAGAMSGLVVTVGFWAYLDFISILYPWLDD